MPDQKAPFWRTKRMAEMTKAEWESLCDGCGRCCLNKLIDEDTDETVSTPTSAAGCSTARPAAAPTMPTARPGCATA